MRALGNIMHECSHYTFAPTKKANIFFGNFISFLDLSSFDDYQDSHKLHHQYLGDNSKDEDYKKYLRLIRPYKNKNINQIILFIFIVFNPLNWLYYIAKNTSLSFSRIIYISIIIICCLFTNKCFAFLVIPYLTTYQIMKISSDFLDHHNIYFSKEDFFKTRNHAFRSKILNLLFFPRNDAFHLVHHMYPQIPVTHLHEKHTQLMQTHTVYKGRKHFLI